MNERRRAIRSPAHQSPWETARVRPGRDVSLVDLGDDGALVEGTTRLMPGTRVVLQLNAGERSLAVAGLVVRCEVASLDRDRGIRYRGALRFEMPLSCAESKTQRG
jgi:hypothetical protein